MISISILNNILSQYFIKKNNLYVISKFVCYIFTSNFGCYNVNSFRISIFSIKEYRITFIKKIQFYNKIKNMFIITLYIIDINFKFYINFKYKFLFIWIGLFINFYIFSNSIFNISWYNII